MEILTVWKLRSVFITAPGIILSTILMGSLSLISSIWDRKGYTQHRIAQAWARMVLKVGFMRCTVIGLEKLDPSQSYVIVCNHASYMDTPTILSVLPLQFRFFATVGLFSIPFMGWHLSRAGHIPVARDNVRASLKSMGEGARMIRETGVSALLFPEGARTEHDMRPFKEGAAYIAIKAQVPVVPMGVRGTRDALPMHCWRVRGGPVELFIGDPVETKGMTLQQRGTLTQELQDMVAALAGQTVTEGE
ncbi:MAG: 1-acyl-sn-glycerol-3-phosphate acyltransferase [Bryobacterales bacterium]|nr:1-acyl-sn-glycerol-3-phosphate acyltransferase [Bryobacterales bacterium]